MVWHVGGHSGGLGRNSGGEGGRRWVDRVGEGVSGFDLGGFPGARRVWARPARRFCGGESEGGRAEREFRDITKGASLTAHFGPH